MTKMRSANTIASSTSWVTRMRQGAGENDASNQLPAAQAHDAAEFDQLRVNLADAQRRVDVDWERDAERDQKDLLRLADTKLDDDQRQQRQQRDCPDHLDAAVEQSLGDSGKTDCRAERKADCSPDRETGRRTQQADRHVVGEAAVADTPFTGFVYLAPRPINVRRQPAEAGEALPHSYQQ